ncbi:hypothetical protein OAO18_04130 [Francisellaceae bacterium]|nr:hypothetical protein [Francisellaceae bacterium]
MKLLKLCYTTIFITSLSACSFYKSKDELPPPIVETDQEAVSFSEINIEETLPNAPIRNLKPATARLTLTQKDDILISKQIIDWNDAISGMVLFSWIPPEGSTCPKTTFPIKKYQDTNSLTYTKHSVYDANHRPCPGQWQVKVIEKPNHSLANASLIITTPRQTASHASKPAQVPKHEIANFVSADTANSPINS